LTEAIDTTTAMGEFVFHAFGAIAQYERSLIQERVNAGLRAAKRRGRIGGRPRRLDDEKIIAARALFETMTMSSVARSVGVPRSTMVDSLRRTSPSSVKKWVRMHNLLTVVFESHHAAGNCHRRYQITVGRDLLDDWTVCVCYGRVGQAGQELNFGGPKAEDMRTVVRERLRRRLSAPKRLGCPYRLTVLNSASEFDASEWLPGDVMARFFAA
jgi:Resolvase, N terminal domain/WGR domain